MEFDSLSDAAVAAGQTKPQPSEPVRVDFPDGLEGLSFGQPHDVPDGHDVEWLRDGPFVMGWPDLDDGPYVVRLHWARVDGKARLIGIDLRSFADEDYTQPPQPVTDGDGQWLAPITGGTWRSFKWATVELSRKIMFGFALMGAWSSSSDVIVTAAGEPIPHDRAEERRRLDALREKPPPRGVGGRLGDDHYRDVARVYLAADQARRPDVLNAVREHFAGSEQFPTVSRAMAHQWRREAKRRGFLQDRDTRMGRPRKSQPNGPEHDTNPPPKEAP